MKSLVSLPLDNGELFVIDPKHIVSVRVLEDKTCLLTLTVGDEVHLPKEASAKLFRYLEAE